MTDKPSEFPTVRRGNVGADDNPTISARLAQFCYILVCVQILFSCYLFIVDWNIYYYIGVEDGLIEYLTAGAFLLAGIVLFTAALIERRVFPCCAYVLGGMAMLFFAGEETSWAQRIIGFETPDFLANLNAQREFNVHNIGAFDYYKPGEYVLSALCIVASAAFCCRKNKIFGISLPPILLTLAMLATLSYTYGDFGTVGSSEILPFVISPHRGLFLLLLVFALFFRNARLFVTVFASISIALAVFYTLSQQDYGDYVWRELFECMFSVVCFFYALTALLSHGVTRQKIMAAVAAFKPAAALLAILLAPPSSSAKQGRFRWNQVELPNAWTLVCLFIIAGSIGVAPMSYFKDRSEVTTFKETYLLIRAAEPTARSKFDLYIDGRDLRYFKEPCDAPDVEAPFFLGIFPGDIDVLPSDRRRHGFANHDFYFRHSNYKILVSNRQYGYMLDGACIATTRLPDYEIARISTGQYVFDDKGVVTNLWIAEFPVGGE